MNRLVESNNCSTYNNYFFKLQGVPFIVNGKTWCLRGSLISVAADNPASNLVGGFKNLSSAFRKCRHCMATGEDIQTKVSEELVYMSVKLIMYYTTQFIAEELSSRTKTIHERHCEGISGPAGNFVTTTYGVNRDSILNKLNYFHVTSGLPPDIMHDIFEGVAVVEIKCMLSEFIQQKNYFNLTTLNNRIKHFPYGYPDSVNKPLPLPSNMLSSTTDSLKQSCKLINLTGEIVSLFGFFNVFDQHLRHGV